MTEFSQEQLEAVADELAERAAITAHQELDPPVTLTDWAPNKKMEIGDTVILNGEETKVTGVSMSKEGKDEIKSEAAASLAKSEHDPIVPPKMTRKVWKEMMRIHFTVRRPTVKSCGHKINIQSDPRNNCADCWFAYFQNNGQMTQIADECFTQAGRDVLERSRGKKFVKFFLMFMSTIARFQREAAARAIAEKEAKANGTETESSTGNPGGESEADTSIGGLAGEAESIGGLSADPSVHDFIAENPINEGSDEGLSPSIG